MTVDEMTDVIDIKPLIPPNVWPLIFIVVVVLLAICLLFYFLLKRKKNKSEIPVEKIISKESPKVLALRKIQELDSSGLLEHHQYRKYYFGISEILRTFIQDEYSIEAVDATTEELLPRIKNVDSFSETQKMNLIFLLSEMDLVKFAKLNPSSESLEKVKKMLKEFIEFGS